MHAALLQSCPTLWDPMDYSPPGSSVHGILQARTLEWVAVPSSRRSSRPRNWTQVSCIACRFFTTQSHQGSPSSKRLHQSSLSGVFCMHLEFSSYMSKQFSCFPSPVLSIHDEWTLQVLFLFFPSSSRSISLLSPLVLMTGVNLY